MILEKRSIIIEIDIKREEMYKCALENGLNNAMTIKISQELDKLLNSLSHQIKFMKRGNA